MGKHGLDITLGGMLNSSQHVSECFGSAHPHGDHRKPDRSHCDGVEVMLALEASLRGILREVDHGQTSSVAEDRKGFRFRPANQSSCRTGRRSVQFRTWTSQYPVYGDGRGRPSPVSMSEQLNSSRMTIVTGSHLRARLGQFGR